MCSNSEGIANLNSIVTLLIFEKSSNACSRLTVKEFDNKILEILYEKAEDDVIDKEMDEASDYK